MSATPPTMQGPDSPCARRGCNGRSAPRIATGGATALDGSAHSVTDIPTGWWGGLRHPLHPERSPLLSESKRASAASGNVREWPMEPRSEEHTSELQSLMRSSYAVFCLKKKKTKTQQRD